MKVLFALTYYRPHVSGLTIYVERLARAMARRGHEVTVLTSHYSRDLPYTEMMDGVRVVRVPVLFRFGKASVMPTFALYAWRLMRQHDVVSVHLPQGEGGLLALMGRYLARKPVVLTYHCDLQLPPGAFNRLIDRVVYLVNYVAGVLADRIVAYTRDYAVHSPFLSRFMDKIEVIYPPIEMPPPEPSACADLRQQYGAEGKRVVGFAARFAEDKGVNYLINAVPLVAERIPNVKFLLAGEYENVIGENVYRRLRPFIEKHQEHVVLLGPLPNRQMGNFFGICDVLTVPSINSTESFGLVQIEAMLSGCPVVASNLPGVREPVRVTSMGEIVPIGDEGALAEAIVKVIENRARYVRPRPEIARMFDLGKTVEAYEELFERVRQEGHRKRIDLTAREKKALDEYQELLSKRFPEQVEQIILFGSKARGDSKPGSDLDTLVVIRDGERPPSRLRDPLWLGIVDAASEILAEYEVYVAPLILTEGEFAGWSPLIDAIRREGIELWSRSRG